jgi:hypothetical protein
VRVDAHATGVTCVAMPETPFTPEIPHFQVALDDVEIDADAVLPGDGYARYVKPFRTVEDAHVCAAAAAHLLRISRASGWPTELSGRLSTVVMSFRSVALLPPDDPAVHVLLGGSLAALADAVQACDAHWAGGDPDVGARWRRDVPLLQIANRAREQRRVAAWTRLAADAR